MPAKGPSICGVPDLPTSYCLVAVSKRNLTEQGGHTRNQQLSPCHPPTHSPAPDLPTHPIALDVAEFADSALAPSAAPPASAAMVGRTPTSCVGQSWCSCWMQSSWRRLCATRVTPQLGLGRRRACCRDMLRAQQRWAAGWCGSSGRMASILR